MPENIKSYHSMVKSLGFFSTATKVFMAATETCVLGFKIYWKCSHTEQYSYRNTVEFTYQEVNNGIKCWRELFSKTL